MLIGHDDTDKPTAFDPPVIPRAAVIDPLISEEWVRRLEVARLRREHWMKRTERFDRWL